VSDGEPHLIDELSGHVLQLRLNRPKQRNAISPEMLCRLADAWQRAEADPQIRVVTISGTGPAFSAGADLKLLVPLLSGDRAAENEWDKRILSEPETAAHAFLRHQPLAKPILAGVNGAATGGGLELLLATTLRIAGESARFGLSEVKRGLLPGGGGVARLPRQLPRTIALEILLTGELIDAQRAAHFGLVNEVAPDEALGERLGALATTIAANGPLAVRLILDVVSQTETASLTQALALEDSAFQTVLQSEDAREGAQAFLEKREPHYVGK
jgi:enoyl-CoA hydratase